ncbi:MAG: hypothetical protein Q4D02_01825 [Clostridia bacterium]|nr:hypothetical protein [Clostridia bacterium]
MLLKDLKKVYISRPKRINEHGEYTIKWIFYKEAYLNLQQDVNELDRKSTGEVNYDIYKARTDKDYDILNGYGISFENIKKREDIIPEYRVISQSVIGNTYLYRLEKYYGT